MQANREYLLQFNVSEEIALYLHMEMEQADLIEKLPVVLMYNLDKERLGEALRKKLLVRLLDSSEEM